MAVELDLLKQKVSDAIDRIIETLEMLIMHFRTIVDNREHWIGIVMQESRDEKAVRFIFQQFYEMVSQPLEEAERKIERIFAETAT